MSLSICRFPGIPFRVIEPAPQTTPFVLNSPHSGHIYPEDFLALSRLTHRSIRSSEDFLVDRLVEEAVVFGMPLLAANFPRAYLDVNREPYELDQTMFSEQLPAFVNSRSVRVSSGLGTVAKIVAEGREIYKRRICVADALNRIETLYKPYHAELRGLLAKTHVSFGHAVLVDCHSMPSNNALQQNEERPDIVLGDRFGVSCDPMLVHQAKDILRDLGFQVALNKPYAGGFITEHYGRPENGLHAFQLEINRGLYMNEKTLEPSSGFDDVQRTLTRFFELLSLQQFENLEGSVSLAAE